MKGPYTSQLNGEMANQFNDSFNDENESYWFDFHED